jgi:hypothetical protein
MHLKQHSDVLEAGLRQCIVHPVHRPLDEVGAGALDRRVDRGPLGAAAEIGVGRANVGEMGLPPNSVRVKPCLADEGQRIVDIGANSGKRVK